MDDDGQSTAPPGRFTALSLGDYESCAVSERRSGPLLGRPAGVPAARGLTPRRAIRQSGKWNVPLLARSPTLSLEDPVDHHLLDLGRDRQPRPVPGDPLHAGGVRGRGAARRSTRAPRRSTSTPARPTARRRYEIEDFRAITEAIRAEVGDVIINYSTGAIGVPIEKRIAYLRELQPDVAALNMSSMNYAKYSRAAQGLRLQGRLREQLRHDHRVPRRR